MAQERMATATQCVAPTTSSSLRVSWESSLFNDNRRCNDYRGVLSVLVIDGLETGPRVLVLL
jgi:hypothetical protein